MNVVFLLVCIVLFFAFNQFYDPYHIDRAHLATYSRARTHTLTKIPKIAVAIVQFVEVFFYFAFALQFELTKLNKTTQKKVGNSLDEHARIFLWQGFCIFGLVATRDCVCVCVNA